MDFIVKVEYSYPRIYISGINPEELTTVNEYLHQYFIQQNYSEEEKVAFLDESLKELVDFFSVLLENQQQTEPEEYEKQDEESKPEHGAEVAIQNPNDITEVAIKENLSIGQIFNNGYAELYRTIGGVKMLGMKKHNGTVVEELKGGKQKGLAKSIIKQYIDTAEREDVGRYSIQITDIFEQPIISVFDNRGKHTVGFFSKRLLPTLITYLVRAYDDEQICTNVAKLSRDIGIVDKRYKTKQDFTQIDSRFTVKMVNRFYGKTNRELELIVYRMLDNLQDNYSCISYEKNFWITTDDWDSHTSSASEKSIIRKSQSKVLKEFGASKMFTIFARNQAEDFYNRVIEYINQTYDLNWIKYKNQIEITIEDIDALKELQESLIKDGHQPVQALTEARSRLVTKLYRTIQSDFQKANEKEMQVVLDDPEIDAEYKAMLECGIYSIRELAKKGIIKKVPFHYWESTLNVQCDLISLLIGQIDYDMTAAEIAELEKELPF